VEEVEKWKSGKVSAKCIESIRQQSCTSAPR